MYTIDPYTFNKFATEQFIPVIEDINVTNAAQPGAIDIIRVDYPGNFYNNWYIGQFTPGDVGYGGNPNSIRLNSPSPQSSQIQNISSTGTVVTVTTIDTHGFKGGAVVTIRGTEYYNGTYSNITVLSDTSFSFLSVINETESAYSSTTTVELYISSSPYTSYATNFYENCKCLFSRS